MLKKWLVVERRRGKGRRRQHRRSNSKRENRRFIKRYLMGLKKNL